MHRCLPYLIFKGKGRLYLLFVTKIGEKRLVYKGDDQMRKLLFFALFIGVLLSGCNQETVFSSKPPNMYIEVDGEQYETKLGTYCWTKGCVDTVGPQELLQGKEPIQVTASEKITLQLQGDLKNTEFHLALASGEAYKEVPLEEYTFLAPIEPGMYYYSAGVWWKDPKEENVSKGDAFYAFVIEVQ